MNFTNGVFSCRTNFIYINLDIYRINVKQLMTRRGSSLSTVYPISICRISVTLHLNKPKLRPGFIYWALKTPYLTLITDVHMAHLDSHPHSSLQPHQLPAPSHGQSMPQTPSNQFRAPTHAHANAKRLHRQQIYCPSCSPVHA